MPVTFFPFIDWRACQYIYTEDNELLHFVHENQAHFPTTFDYNNKKYNCKNNANNAKHLV